MIKYRAGSGGLFSYPKGTVPKGTVKELVFLLSVSIVLIIILIAIVVNLLPPLSQEDRAEQRAHYENARIESIATERLKIERAMERLRRKDWEEVE